MIWKKVAAIPLGLAIASTATAEEVVVSDMAKPNWSFYGDVRVKPVDAEKAPGGQLLRADVIRKGKNYWDSAASGEPIKAIDKDQIVTLGFFARAGSDDVQVWVNANVGQIAAPYDAAVIARINLDEEERFYCLEGSSKVKLNSGEGKVTLHLGGEKQKVDIGPYIVTVRNADDGPSQLPCEQIVPSW
ncbi:hypothetical protein ACRAQ7_09190 [Erythrobacter sp. W53]|uniref:hypothetical protein n=1 Tax=Erythrobacter sp. W53 TaxID=3425947 RepID=UPI003D767EE7